jgi:hypothetical protein
MRAVRRNFSPLIHPVMLLAILGLATPASLTFLAATPNIEVSSQAHNDACEQHPSEQGLALGHDRRCPPEGGSAGVARGDFNGDGVTDLAIGVPGEDRSLTTFDGLGGGSTREVPDAGAVHIIYGSASGLTSTGNQLFDQATGKADNDRFGAALASGDFNGDPYSDLAVGVPGERDSSGRIVGAVQIFYGTPAGLSRTGSQVFQAGLFSIPVSGPDLAVVFKENMSLVWGDFDGNLVGDLAIEGAAQSPSCDVGVILLFGAESLPLSTSRMQ